MDAVTESGTLLVGTNTFAILTQSITDWVNFNDLDHEFAQQQSELAIEYDSNGEEIKDPYAEDSEYRNRYDASDYDVLEGQNVDDALEDIYNQNGGTLAFLQEQERKILAQDA